LDPRMEVKGLIVEKCKFMDSKKLPLWLVFENSDEGEKPIFVILKSGDDLRQDMLTLQMISIMDKLWQIEGLDLRMLPYGCIATGEGVGMIEVVLDADTASNIQKAIGGANAAFQKEPLLKWLKLKNPLPEKLNDAIETFVLSCAGYAVATYVLGIGDRHNDNIMVTASGNLFHIDFGHFLGHFKKKFGVNRERAPFVFTPAMAFVMGGRDSPQFKRFVDISCKAYNTLRKHANMFINLFAMMLATGIPELESESDINYLRKTFEVDLTDEEAAEKFTQLIYKSLDTKATQVNDYIHNLVH